MTETRTRETLRFGDFELNLGTYELRRNGRTVRLERLPMDLLIMLVGRRGDLVTRAEIVDHLWGKDVFVDVETGVHTAIRKIRQALHDSADAPSFIETVPGRGYRFIGTVESVTVAGELPAPAKIDAPEPAVLAPTPVSSRGKSLLIGGALVLGIVAAFAVWRWTSLAWPRAREAASRALQSDPNLAEAQFAMAYVNWMFDWDWTAAESRFRRATVLDPNHSMSHMILGHLLSQRGRHDLARLSMRRSRELDPLSPMPHAISSQVEFQARNYPAALEHARQAIALDPEFWIGHMMQAQALDRMDLGEPAIEALTKAGRFSGQNSKTLSVRGYVLAKAGRTAEARAVLETLQTAARDRYVPPYAIAIVHAGLGERDSLFEALDRAYAARDVHLIFLPVDPKWDEYRQDPRFVALLARCGFVR